MSLATLIHAVQNDKSYEAEVKTLAEAAKASGDDQDTPEWKALNSKIAEHLTAPGHPKPLTCVATVFTATTAECTITTTTTTWR